MCDTELLLTVPIGLLKLVQVLLEFTNLCIFACEQVPREIASARRLILALFRLGCLQFELQLANSLCR